MIYVLCAILFASMVTCYDQDYCFASEENPYLMYGTKTAYEFVHEKPRNPEAVPCKYTLPLELTNLFKQPSIWRNVDLITLMHI